MSANVSSDRNKQLVPMDVMCLTRGRSSTTTRRSVTLYGNPSIQIAVAESHGPSKRHGKHFLSIAQKCQCRNHFSNPRRSAFSTLAGLALRNLRNGRGRRADFHLVVAGHDSDIVVTVEETDVLRIANREVPVSLGGAPGLE
jgi:hypothetical protein